MPTNPSVICDAVKADLINAGLIPKTWQLYVEPRVEDPEACPYAAVWALETDYEILTGAAGLQAFERKHHVNISWSVYSSQEAETGGTGDPATVQALEVIGELIVDRVATYAGGIPGLGSELVGTLTRRSMAPKSGVIWELLIEFTAEEAA